VPPAASVPPIPTAASPAAAGPAVAVQEKDNDNASLLVGEREEDTDNVVFMG